MKNRKEARNSPCARIFAFIFLMGAVLSPSFSFALDYTVKVIDGVYYYTPLFKQESFRRYSSYDYPAALSSALSVSCAAIPTAGSVGESILWYSSVTGGAGNYQYFWSGTDGLSAYTSSIRKSYDLPGIKYATVAVISGRQSVTVGCTRGITIAPAAGTAAAPALGISCYAAQERIAPGGSATWLAVVTGASPFATTTYEWQGTDGLSGTDPAVFKTYTITGLKHALLKVTNGGNSVVSSCTNGVTVAMPTPAFSQSATQTIHGVCSPSVTLAETGDEIIWSARATGGRGAYTFRWNGDDGLVGTSATTSMHYEREGKKSAKVTIASGGKEITVSCGSNVDIAPRHGLFAAVFLSDWFDALCLILAAFLAIAIGIILAIWRQKREWEHNSQEHKV